MNEELLPCPFCGGAATIEESNLLGDIRKSAGCGTEHCQGYQSTLTFSTHREAIAAWNTRVAHNELDMEMSQQEVRQEMADAMDCANDPTVTTHVTSEHEQQPWTIAAHSLSYDEVSLMDLNVTDVEKLVKEACLTYAVDQIGALHAAARARDKAFEERDEARREIERLKSEVRELRDVIRRGANESRYE